MIEPVLRRHRIEILWSTEDDVFVASAPRLGPGIAARAPTAREALGQIETLLEQIEASYHERGWELPEAGVYSGQLRVRMPRSLHASLAAAARSESVSLNTLIVSCLARCMTQPGL